MRDYAKTTKHNQPQSKYLNSFSTPERTLTSRKLILGTILLTLIAAFIISFYTSKPTTESTQKITAPSSSTLNTISTLTKQAEQMENQTTRDHGDTVTTALVPLSKNNQTDTSTYKQNIDKVTTNNKKQTNNPSKQEQKKQDQSLQFTFYDTLTNKTVQVDANPQPIKQYRYTYMLQVGSYRNLTDANATRAKLILAGLKPTIQKVGDWYRLDVGPVDNQRDGDVLKHKVEAAGISGSILRQIDRQEIT
ncbi:SPOR domain-containing protein [Fastidiosibacter lacustris]|uniref:SPOR domain-containing protein n=1 Tax=Fastidiosibacter lacustris TaxID=2056695 RepID=UPI000E3579A3|nr:SPOR domain-containing protein [Fastidiosibacter lacustris]